LWRRLVFIGKSELMLLQKWKQQHGLTFLGELKMRLLLVMLLTLPLTNCASLTATPATNGSVCNVWKDISWSKKDTDQTITEIKVNNARRDGWCEGQK
jgi:hypothetical protein